MQKSISRSSALTQFILCSAVGIFIFFVNVQIGEKKKTLLLHIIDNLKATVTQPGLRLIVMCCCLTTLVLAIYFKVKNEGDSILRGHFKRDSYFNYFTYITAAIFSVMIVLNVGPAFIIDPKVGLSSMNVSSDVLVAVIIAGTLVTFLVEYGLLEFLGKLVEPIMRRLYKLPGQAAVEAMSSFATSPAVDVMVAQRLFRKGIYTEKEVASITTNFTICSMGAFVFLSNIAGCGEYYMQVMLTALVISLIMPIITIRIPPLSWKKDVYFDGHVQTNEERVSSRYDKNIFKNALDTAVEKVQGTHASIFGTTMLNACIAALKVCSFVVSLSVIGLAIANYTPFVDIIGKPIVPILNLLQIPDAETIAPSTLVSIFALSLPATLLKDTGVAVMSAFYIVVLSTSQVIFFTESANAILDSEIPLNFWDLLMVFIVRTVILIPLVAIPAHLLFG